VCVSGVLRRVVSGRGHGSRSRFGSDAASEAHTGGARESQAHSKRSRDFSVLFSMVCCPLFLASRPNMLTVFIGFGDFFQFVGGA